MHDSLYHVYFLGNLEGLYALWLRGRTSFGRKFWAGLTLAVFLGKAMSCSLIVRFVIVFLSEVREN